MSATTAGPRTAGTVLVLGEGVRAFLAVIRSLGRRGLEVHTGWVPPASLPVRSRYVARVHDIPPFRPDDDAWRRSLAGILEAERFDLVIPCTDATLIPLVLHRTELAPLARLAIPDDHAFQVAFDKIRTVQLAAASGVRVPRSVVVSDAREIGDVVAALGLPCVVKPRRSHTVDDLARRHCVRTARTAGDLAALVREMLPGGAVQVQQHVRGVGVGVEVLADRGDVLFAFQHRRVHEAVKGGGGSSYRTSVPLDAGLLEAAARLMKALAFTGVAMVEFRVDLATGEWVLLEINGRFWGSLPLAVAAGADFPYYLYELLVRGRRDFPRSYRTGLHARNLSRDLVWFAANVRADRTDATMNRLPVWRAAAEVVNVVTLRERIDTLTMDDPLPGLLELLALARRCASATGTAMSRIADVTLRARRRAAARAALRRARRLLFVCSGNICRSPFAEQYARTVLPPSIAVASCGFHPNEGRPTPPAGVDAATRLGIDLRAHRSTIATDALVRDADVIFVFDRASREHLLRCYPAARSKTHFLGVLAPRGPLMVRNPDGGDVLAFHDTYACIARALDAGRPADRAPAPELAELASRGAADRGGSHAA